MNELLAKLADPFKPEYIVWKPGSTTKDKSKCMAMAYADLRAYMERLDELLEMDWTIRYEPWGDRRIVAHLTIAGVTRCSTGEYDAQDEKTGIGGTVAEAQAFKRAAAMFGLGRYLYDLPSAWVAFDAASSRITKEGQAELDGRYKAWYTRIVAQQKPTQAAQTPVETIEAEKQPAARPYESPPHQRLFGQLTSGFGMDAEAVRPWLIKTWTTKNTPTNIRTSAAALSDDEKDLIADDIKQHLSVLQGRWKNHKAAMQQSTGERQPIAA